MKTSVIVAVFALVQAASAADPITVNVSGGGGGGGGGGSKVDLSASELTNKYCVYKGKSCDKAEMLKSVFATTRDLMMSKCNNKLECLGVSIDDMRHAHFLGERCTEVELTDSENDYFYRLGKGESCAAPAEPHVRAVAKYSPSFCMVTGKACPGHGIYKRPQNIPDYMNCLVKCAKIKECTGVDFHLRDNKQCEPILHECTDEDLQDEEITTHYVRLLKGVTSCADARVTGAIEAGEPQEPTEAPTEEPEPDTEVDPEEPTEPPTEEPTPQPTEKPIVNLAKSKPTYQSGIGWNGASSRAVDGNPSGNYWDHSCTHTDKRFRPYWVVDLGEAADVNGIQIVNRRDCCSDRLKNFKVVVTNTKPEGDSPSYTDAEICGYRKGSHQGTLNLKCGSALNGRYVMIQLQYKEYLTLCEVRVYAGELPEGNWINGDPLDKNLAKGKKTWQSGIGWNGESSRAIDGNDSGNYWHHSCTHTDLRDKPYWVVDLGQAYGVTGISIANRKDCCSDRLKNFKVVVTNTEPAGNTPSFSAGEVCSLRKNAYTGTINLKCDSEISGRYVMIQLQDKQYLTICEVAVYAGDLPEGTWIQGDNVTGNLAKEKVTWQSGIGWHGASSRAVDGNPSGNYWQHSCTHTDKRDKPYWTVDLGEEYDVTGVSITNRKDCCSDRLRSYKVVVTNTKPTGDYPSYTDSEVCASRMKSHSGALGLKCKDSMRGRYVMIQLQYKEYLTLCEVEVYAGTLPEGSWVEGDNANGNIALEKSTWQSGIGWDGAASRAVDGNDSGNYWQHSCTHTDKRDKPYWVVDLGQAYGVTGISIANRKDCCSSRLKMFHVVVTNTRPEGSSPSYGASEVCASRKDSHSGTLNLKCGSTLNGRYVMIQLQYEEYLTLCEVMVYAGELPGGTWISGDAAISSSLAQGKSTYQSGIGWNGQSSRAVDGNTSGNYWHHTCTHTDKRDKPYWVVDLGRAHTVTSVAITNRADCCHSRLQKYRIVVTNTKPSGAYPSYTEQEICHYSPGTHSGTRDVKCDSSISGRYVMIQLQYREYLTLCEVKVNGF